MHFCAMSVRNALDEAAWAFFGGMLINFYARYLFRLFCAVIPFEQVSIPSISNRHILMWRFDVVPAHLWRQTMSAARIFLINDEEAYLIWIAGKICHLSLLILVFTAITRHPAATATFSLCRSITLNILPVHRKQFSAPIYLLICSLHTRSASWSFPLPLLRAPTELTDPHMSPMQWPFAPPSPLTHQKLLLPCASVCELPQITCMQNNFLLEWVRRWHYMCIFVICCKMITSRSRRSRVCSFKTEKPRR